MLGWLSLEKRITKFFKLDMIIKRTILRKRGKTGRWNIFKMPLTVSYPTKLSIKKVLCICYYWWDEDDEVDNTPQVGKRRNDGIINFN